MVQLCFLLDLRTLKPSLLKDLKKTLLQLVEYYSTSKQIAQNNSTQLSLCYLENDECIMSYLPSGNFTANDFKLAVDMLPDDSIPNLDNISDVKLSQVLRALDCWEGKKKVIIITSTLPGVDSSMEKSILDGGTTVYFDFTVFQQDDADKCISDDTIKSINSFDNCLITTYCPDSGGFDSVLKKWQKVLKTKSYDASNVASSSNSKAYFLVKVKSFDDFEVRLAELQKEHDYLDFQAWLGIKDEDFTSMKIVLSASNRGKHREDRMSREDLYNPAAKRMLG